MLKVNFINKKAQLPHNYSVLQTHSPPPHLVAGGLAAQRNITYWEERAPATN